MPSADSPRRARGAGPGLRGPAPPARRGHTRDAPREPLAERAWLSGGEGETPAGFRCQRPGGVGGRGRRARTGAAGGKRPEASPGAGRPEPRRGPRRPGRPGPAVVFLGGQRRKNNRRSDGVCLARGSAACAFLGKSRKPFPRSEGRGCGLKPPRERQKAAPRRDPAAPPDVPPLLAPQARLSHLHPRPPEPRSALPARRGGEGTAAGRAAGPGPPSQSQSFVIRLPEQQKSNR